MALQLKSVTKLALFAVVALALVLHFESSVVNSQQLTATLPPRAPSCALSCPTGDNDKICASNGVTYKNQCRFDCAKQRNKRLRLVKKGDCNAASLSDYRRG